MWILLIYILLIYARAKNRSAFLVAAARHYINETKA